MFFKELQCLCFRRVGYLACGLLTIVSCYRPRCKLCTTKQLKNTWDQNILGLHVQVLHCAEQEIWSNHQHKCGVASWNWHSGRAAFKSSSDSPTFCLNRICSSAIWAAKEEFSSSNSSSILNCNKKAYLTLEWYLDIKELVIHLKRIES